LELLNDGYKKKPTAKRNKCNRDVEIYSDEKWERKHNQDMLLRKTNWGQQQQTISTTTFLVQAYVTEVQWTWAW